MGRATGGCVCFPRIKKEVDIDIAGLHNVLLKKYKTYLGRGHWFDEDNRFMRIGYGWETTEKLAKGLNNILLAINEVK